MHRISSLGNFAMVLSLMYIYIGVEILFKKNSFAVSLESCHLTCQISSFKETKIPLLFARILNLSKSNPSTEEKQNEI